MAAGAEALARPNRLLCQLMQLGTAEAVRAARDLLGDDAFRDALRSAPPGILDAKSWNFWHLVLLGQAPHDVRPRIDALPAPQRALWPELAVVPRRCVLRIMTALVQR